MVVAVVADVCVQGFGDAEPAEHEQGDESDGAGSGICCVKEAAKLVGGQTEERIIGTQAGQPIQWFRPDRRRSQTKGASNCVRLTS